jgi:hypothetical protein
MTIVIIVGGFMWALRSPTIKAALLAGLVVGIALATLLVFERNAGDSPFLIYLSCLLGSVPLLLGVHSLEGVISRTLLIIIGGYILLMGGPILAVRLWIH